MEILEFDKYPIWDKQSEESEEDFLKFSQWFLPQLNHSALKVQRLNED